ncbi:MAG: CerR family C-terminal domain-containing protein [Planctomycetota bacterium]
MDPRAQRTRDALLESAKTLFAERGYVAVATREITDRAGVNVASIAYHFGSKRDLYLAAVKDALHRPEVTGAWDLLRAEHPGRNEAIRTFEGFVRGMVEGMLIDEEFGACTCLMLREALQPSEAIDEVVAEIVAPREELLVGIVRAIAPAASTTEARHAARSILGQVLHQHLFRHFVERLQGRKHRPADVRAIADHVVRFSLRGIGCTDAVIDRALRAGRTPRKSSSPTKT